MQLVEHARLFACAAHKATGHKRKYTGACYTVHLAEVAQLVAKHGGTPAMIAAAWLHDVVEDTAIESADITKFFGPEIAELVSWLTDISKPEDGNRKIRKAMDRTHLAAAPREAQIIKACDLMSNARDICQHDVGFGRVFLDEATELLDAMSKVPADIRSASQAILSQSRDVLT